MALFVFSEPISQPGSITAEQWQAYEQTYAFTANTPNAYSPAFQRVLSEIYPDADARQEQLVITVVAAALDVLKDKKILTDSYIETYARKLFKGSASYADIQEDPIPIEMIADRYLEVLTAHGIIQTTEEPNHEHARQRFIDRMIAANGKDNAIEAPYAQEFLQHCAQPQHSSPLSELFADLRQQNLLLGEHNIFAFNQITEADNAYRNHYREEMRRYLQEVEEYKERLPLKLAIIDRYKNQLGSRVTDSLLQSLQSDYALNEEAVNALLESDNPRPTLADFLMKQPAGKTLHAIGMSMIELQRDAGGIITLENHIRDVRQYNDWVFDTRPRIPQIIRNAQEIRTPFRNEGGWNENPRPQPAFLKTFNTLFGNEITIQNPGIKSLERLESKFSRTGLFLDINRCRIACTDYQTLSTIQTKLNELAPVHENRPDMYVSGAYKNTFDLFIGGSDSKIALASCEIQFADPELARANEISHPIYELLRKVTGQKSVGIRAIEDMSEAEKTDFLMEYNHFMSLMRQPEQTPIVALLNQVEGFESFKPIDLPDVPKQQEVLNSCVLNLQRLHQATHVYFMARQNEDWRTHFAELAETRWQKQETKYQQQTADAPIYEHERFPAVFLGLLREGLDLETSKLGKAQETTLKANAR